MIRCLKPETIEDIRASKPFLYIITVMILVGFALQIVFSYGFGIGKDFIPCVFFFSMIPFLILFNFYIKQGEVKYEDIGVTSKNLFNNAIIGLSVGVFAGVLGIFLLSFMSVSAEKITGDKALQVFVLLFLSLCVCAPFWEEVMTRGLFYAFIEKITRSKFNEKRFVKDFVIILIVSLFFLFAHVDREPKLLFVIFIASVVYTVAYHKTRNILVPILAHSVYNLFIILRMFI